MAGSNAAEKRRAMSHPSAVLTRRGAMGDHRRRERADRPEERSAEDDRREPFAPAAKSEEEARARPTGRRESAGRSPPPTARRRQRSPGRHRRGLRPAGRRGGSRRDAIRRTSSTRRPRSATAVAGLSRSRAITMVLPVDTTQPCRPTRALPGARRWCQPHLDAAFPGHADRRPAPLVCRTRVGAARSHRDACSRVRAHSDLRTLRRHPGRPQAGHDRDNSGQPPRTKRPARRTLLRRRRRCSALERPDGRRRSPAECRR